MNKKSIKLNTKTTYRFGGICKNFYVLEDKNDLYNFNNIQDVDEIFVLGKGSNVAFSEQGFEGLVIQSKIDFVNYESSSNIFKVGSGLYLPKLSRILKSHSLTGGEFLLGIPGTVGGALRMNAGCYGYQFMDSVRSFEYFDFKTKKIKKLTKSEINYGYRYTDIINSLILSVELEFSPADPSEISKLMKEFTQHRKKTQPSAIYNAGSVFKNGDDYYAAELIETAGLKGFTIGGVKVSEKHANFFIAEKGAKSSSLYDLVKHVKESVKSKHGVDLEEEIIFVGEFT